MRAGAASPADRRPHWHPGQNRLVLALTLGLHLLAGFRLQQQCRPTPVRAAASQVVTILLQLPETRLTRPPAPAPARMATPLREPRHDVAPRPNASDRPAPPPTQRPPATVTAAPPARTQPAIDPLAPTPAPADAAALAHDPAAAVNGSFTVGLAKREAGRIDRELRGGKSGVPLEADTPWARFQRGLEDAHIDRSLNATEDSYTSPDGVVIYRRRVGSRVTCYRTGSVGLGVAGAVGINDAGSITCPKGVVWQRDN